MRRIPLGLVFFALCLCLLFPACATKRYWGPSMGRSADSQFTPVEALEKAAKSSSFDCYRSKTVWVDVYTLTDRFGEESPEERFLRAWMNEKLAAQGTRLAAQRGQAEVILEVRARVFGIHQTRRDFIPIIYWEATDGLVDLHLTAYEKESGKILSTEDMKAEAKYREYYIFYIIGPIKKMQ